MCYPTPGPRCSNHAHQEYLVALRKFERCDDPGLKILLGVKLDEKRTVYETTPRGQNELRRAADLAEGLEKEELQLRLTQGKNTRENQLKEYNFSVKNKKDGLTDFISDKPYARGKYQDACAIAALFLTDKFTDEDFHIEDLSTCVSVKRKVLVLPEKYSKKQGACTFENEKGYVTDDVLLQKVFKESIIVSKPSPRNQEYMMTWFISKLKAEGYTHVVSVNRATENSVMAPIESLHQLYNIHFKMKHRLGGSTSYRGNVADLTPLLEGTELENGNMLQPEKTYKTIIYGVPFTEQVILLSSEVFVSWRPPLEGEEGYYEVRKRHFSANYDITVVVEVKKTVHTSGVFTSPVISEPLPDMDVEVDTSGQNSTQETYVEAELSEEASSNFTTSAFSDETVDEEEEVHELERVPYVDDGYGYEVYEESEMDLSDKDLGEDNPLKKPSSPKSNIWF